MTIEEKAKAYDEALELARDYYKANLKLNNADENLLLEDIFPELKESEDEKIRKALIKGVECCKASGWTNFGNNVDIDVVIAWLEKQGEQKPIDYNKELKKCRENPLYFFDKYVKLEKKPQGKTALEAIKEEKVDNANKIEPKFKVGDYIVSDYCTGRVVEITNDAYLLDIGQGIPFSCENNVHLWTIADAKEGNILAGKIDGDNYILIFKTIKDGWIGTYGHYYNAVDRFCAPSQLFCRSYQGTFTPATKEQCELLFKKMKEAGYEWNADKKELKKIEQKPVLDFKASNWYVSKVDGKIHDMTYNPADKVEPRFKVKYAGSEYNVLEVKDIAGVTFYGIEDEPNHIDYVKAENCEIISGYAIKENGSPYPTKPAVFSEKKPTAWSDEDEKMCQETINWFEKKCFPYALEEENPARESIKWLKSLKERITWKPSKEQIEALDDALNERGFDYNYLNSLYEQLKKL